MVGLIIISFIVTLLCLLLLRPLAIKYNFVDHPNDRKNHIGSVPLIGGICIFFGVLASQIFIYELDKTISLILIAALLILILGIWDDIVNLKANLKLVIQIFLVALTIYFTEMKLESLGYIFGSSFPLDLGFFSVPFTIIAVVGLTNSFNMMDGIDGLASSLSIIALIGILSFSLYIEGSLFNNILLGFCSALIPFLIFNTFSDNKFKFKVFLGDGGSLLLGFIISWSLIYNVENTKSFSPSFALWCVAVPLYDFFAVVILRKIERRSLIIANRDHIHHNLELFGFSKIIILILITFFGLTLLLIGHYLENNFPLLSFPAFIVLFTLYFYVKFSFKMKTK